MTVQCHCGSREHEPWQHPDTADDDLRRALGDLIDRYEGVGTVTGHTVAWDLRAALAARSEPRAEWDRNRRDMQDPSFRLDDEAVRSEPRAEGLDASDIAYIANCIPWEREDLRQYVRRALAATPSAEGLDVERLPHAASCSYVAGIVQPVCSCGLLRYQHNTRDAALAPEQPE